MPQGLKEHFRSAALSWLPRHRFISFALLVFLNKHIQSYVVEKNSIQNLAESFWVFITRCNLASLFDSSSGLLYNIKIANLMIATILLFIVCCTVRHFQSGIFDLFLKFDKIKSGINTNINKAYRDRKENELINLELSKIVRKRVDEMEVDFDFCSFSQELSAVCFLISIASFYFTQSNIDIVVGLSSVIVFLWSIKKSITIYFTKYLPDEIYIRVLTKQSLTELIATDNTVNNR